MKIEKIERYDKDDKKSSRKILAVLAVGVVCVASLLGLTCAIKDKIANTKETYRFVSENQEEGYRIVEYDGVNYRIPLAYHLEKKGDTVVVVGVQEDKKHADIVYDSDGTVHYTAAEYQGYTLEGEYIVKRTEVSYPLSMFVATEDELTNSK